MQFQTPSEMKHSEILVFVELSFFRSCFAVTYSRPPPPVGWTTDFVKVSPREPVHIDLSPLTIYVLSVKDKKGIKRDISGPLSDDENVHLFLGGNTNTTHNTCASIDSTHYILYFLSLLDTFSWKVTLAFTPQWRSTPLQLCTHVHLFLSFRSSIAALVTITFWLSKEKRGRDWLFFRYMGKKKVFRVDDEANPSAFHWYIHPKADRPNDRD